MDSTWQGAIVHRQLAPLRTPIHSLLFIIASVNICRDQPGSGVASESSYLWQTTNLHKVLAAANATLDVFQPMDKHKWVRPVLDCEQGYKGVSSIQWVSLAVFDTHELVGWILPFAPHSDALRSCFVSSLEGGSAGVQMTVTTAALDPPFQQYLSPSSEGSPRTVCARCYSFIKVLGNEPGRMNEESESAKDQVIIISSNLGYSRGIHIQGQRRRANVTKAGSEGIRSKPQKMDWNQRLSRTITVEKGRWDCADQ
ncbi:FRAS1-related extracellular matrix protein 2 [Platysternon megacephalum]|uniref:FRAS1-related extracellular matrix protein 2 n=1 Tax=Platysternon megacephalum TaxID=55544 RepID=A0A4D9DLH7_9SAUR|nr:FRAS1-related extracellular matrix protein 2 [Platysternon megacephalum]